MTKRKILFVIIVAVVVVGLIILTAPNLSNFTVSGVLAFMPSSPVLTALILIAIFCAKSVVVFIPVYVLYVSAGLMFPTPVAMLVVYIGLALEYSLGYFYGHKLGGGRMRAKLCKVEKVNSFFNLVDRYNNSTILLARLLPMPIPVDVVSMFFGSGKKPFLPFLGLSLAGGSAMMIPLVIAGKSIDNPLSAEFIIPLCIGIGIAFLFCLVERQLNRKIKSGKVRVCERRQSALEN